MIEPVLGKSPYSLINCSVANISPGKHGDLTWVISHPAYPPAVNIHRFPTVLAMLLLMAAAALSPAVAAEPASPATLAAKGPSAPVGLAMVANSSNSITLTWRSPNTDTTGYNIYIGYSPDAHFAHFTTVTEPTLTHEGLTPGITHYYKVSALRENAESALSAPAAGFTIAPWQPKPFPARIAKNMCVTLGMPVVSNTKPLSGKLSHLTDGLDSTSCRIRRGCELKIQLDPALPIADAAYLLLNVRADCGPARALKNYVIIESRDSTNGEDGTWTDVVTGVSELLDGVVVIPNHKPRWVGVRSAYNPNAEIPKTNDRRPMPNDLILCRLDVFRAPPAGYRNDYWIFTGDSLVVQDMPAASDPGRQALFSDLIRKHHPDRYPIVVHAGMGGERLMNTLPRTRRILSFL